MPNTFFSPFGGTANPSGGSSGGVSSQTFSNIGAAHDLNFRYLLKRDSRASWICPMSYSFLPFFDWHG